ncbi:MULTISPECIES: helix-turn-helix transcriptional regulator [unclassified Chelatococcus]|uniref:helix-turn-helix transcriptional regulator n=1 Tax=unclassified Chelatococcus TaxID=2638111 RepID=UPI001BCBE614|nr:MULTISPECIES: helix-turn-helix transcriptional regulator [unclassified Chelatococcus]MBS7699205.1 helix-turn-helix transcriptional regulator [Chelatococcus sp. YT9]MBX3554986.1 helix-turn-helix transcriptional regulator [Chelatococcus sp.]
MDRNILPFIVTVPPGFASMLRLSTNDVPHRQRMAFVHDFVARHFSGLEFVPFVADELHVEMAAYALPGGTTLGSCQYPSMRGSRPRRLLGDGRDGYLLTVHGCDHEVAVDGRPPVKIAAGDILIINQAVPFTFELAATMVTGVTMAPGRLGNLVPYAEGQPYFHIQHAAPEAALMVGYASLLRTNPPASARAAGLAEDHLHDLVALCLGSQYVDTDPRPGSSTASTRLQLMRRDIEARLCDLDINVNTIAGLHGVTPRYVQLLFEREGTTFSAFLRERRLALAHSRLRREPAGRSSIATIAYDCGFSDLSTFNKAFRKRYGATPSDVRADASRGAVS